MKLIPLTKGMFAQVDDEDFDRLSKYKWQPLRQNKTSNNFYARRTARINGKHVTILMHREVYGAFEGRMDHKDGNGLNNQKSNLRPSSPVQNGMNMRLKNAAIPFKGVCRSGSRFRARISINKKTQLLGCFATAEEAARMYDRVAIFLYGEFARTNQRIGIL